MKNKYLYIIGIIIVLMLGGIYNKLTKYQLPESVNLARTLNDAGNQAEAWIKEKATTYTYDGSDLVRLETRALDCELCFSSTFTFTSAHSGFGDRTNVVSLQVLTPHIIEVIHSGGVITSVITDGEYDEMKEKSLNEPALMSVQVYFGNTKKNPNSLDCSEVFPVERIAELRNPPYAATVDLLLGGPTSKEKSAGYFSAINAGVKIQKFTLTNGVAFIDFSKEIERDLGGSCKVTTLRAQVTRTLKEFPGIKNVVISVDGEVESALQP